MAPPLQTRLQSLNDMDLAALATAGDRSAFGELARRHVSGVRALLRRMGADAAMADDVAQDAFLAAYERIVEFRGEGAFAGWVKRIAARLYLKRCKRQLRLADFEEETAESPPQTGGDLAAAQRLDLDGALQLLSPPERLCVSLCFGAGFSHAEAADALKLPLGTVKSHARRGLDKLKAHLATDGPGAGVEDTGVGGAGRSRGSAGARGGHG